MIKLSKSRKIIRTKSIYGKKRNSKKLFNTIIFIVLLLILVSLGFIISMQLGIGQKKDEPASSVQSSSAGQAASSKGESSQASSQTEASVADLNNAKYVSVADMLKSKDQLVALLKDYKSKGYTSVVFELKSDDGTINYNTQNSMAKTYGAISEKTVSLSDLVAAAKDAGVAPIARISTLKDAIAAHVRNANSFTVSGEGSTNWLDASVSKGGKPWLNPYMDNARSYISAIVKEAADAGMETIVLENVNFPLSNGKIGTIKTSPSHAEILSQLIKEAQKAAGKARVINVVNIETLMTSADYAKQTLSDIAAGIAKDNVYLRINDSYVSKNLKALCERSGVSYDEADAAATKKALYKALFSAFGSSGNAAGAELSQADSTALKDILSENGIKNVIIL